MTFPSKVLLNAQGRYTMVQDMFLNLLSEFIGIIVTVFLVDRLIKEREDRRMQPAKNILYVKMTRQLHTFLMALAPIEIEQELKTESGPTHYFYYGDTLCPISSIFNPADYAFFQDYYQKSEITYLCELYSGVEQLRANLDRTLDTSAFLMEPDLLKDSYELLETLNVVVKLNLNPDNDPKEAITEIMVYSYDLAKCVEKAINLMNSLLKKAKRKNPLS
jgi:hypothetical protein